MSVVNENYDESLRVLEETSRTFFIPISRLPGQLQEAVTSAYLCMRAIDEIEDHKKLPADDKISLLQSVGHLLETGSSEKDLDQLFKPYSELLPEVTLQLQQWIDVCPSSIKNAVLQSTATMAKGMADWVSRNWRIHNKQDLDDYTYCVAGAVGLLLSKLWQWHDGIKTDEELAISFGRGLQAVNIIRNRDEDVERGSDFFPDGWSKEDMFEYADKHLQNAQKYTDSITSGPIREFCIIPLALAIGTLQAIKSGKEKLSRQDVTTIVAQHIESYSV